MTQPAIRLTEEGPDLWLPPGPYDLGPNERPEPPKDWRDHLYGAEDEIHSAIRREDDDRQRQRKLRIEAIDRAIEALEKAKGLIAGCAR